MTVGTVLIVDDNPADLQILQTAFEAVDEHLSIVTIESVLEALDWIAQLPPASLSSLLVMTDLNMPVGDGIEMLKGIDALTDPRPVTIVLTTSSRSVEIDRVYSNGANAYHTKPMGYHETAALCEQLLAYWNGCARTPNASLRADIVGDDVVDLHEVRQ